MSQVNKSDNITALVEDSSDKTKIVSGAPLSCKCSWEHCPYESIGQCTYSRFCTSLRGCNKKFCFDHKGFPGYLNKNMVGLGSTCCIECQDGLTQSNRCFWTIFMIPVVLLIIGTYVLVILARIQADNHPSS